MKKVMQFVLSGCLALALAGCTKQQGGSASSSASSGSSATQEKVITFWHLDTTDDQQKAWRTIADRFEAKHPGVKIEITVLANDSFKQKLSTVMQSGWAPDVFRSWGGGGMYDQEDAGMLRDISGLIKIRTSDDAVIHCNLIAGNKLRYKASAKGTAISRADMSAIVLKYIIFNAHNFI